MKSLRANIAMDEAEAKARYLQHKAEAKAAADQGHLIRVFQDGFYTDADGNHIPMWCALVGENIQECLAGFGTDIPEALRKLADEWEEHGWQLAPKEENHDQGLADNDQP